MSEWKVVKFCYGDLPGLIEGASQGVGLGIPIFTSQFETLPALFYMLLI